MYQYKHDSKWYKKCNLPTKSRGCFNNKASSLKNKETHIEEMAGLLVFILTNALSHPLLWLSLSIIAFLDSIPHIITVCLPIQKLCNVVSSMKILTFIEIVNGLHRKRTKSIPFIITEAVTQLQSKLTEFCAFSKTLLIIKVAVYTAK